MNSYNAWGDPEDPQDTHTASNPPYPDHHTDTLVPAVQQAMQSTRTPKFPPLNGMVKTTVIAVGAVGGLWAISLLFGLGSRQPAATPQLQLEPTITDEPAPIAPPPLDDLTSRRNEAWESVRQLCGVELESTALATDQQVRVARKDSWQLYAKQQCDQDPNCGSPYDWLRMQLDERGARIQRIALADRLPIKARQVEEYRLAQADLLDISQALASGVSPLSLSWIPADRLSDAIDDCSRAAKRFESLTRAAVEDAQLFPGGEPDAF